MSDTQWPRYEVFQQHKPDSPLRNAGSVHAPDDEMALLIARDVFVRRPDCYDLWVVRDDQILSRTSEELVDVDPVALQTTESPETYFVFQKRSQAGLATFVEQVGTVAAASGEVALQLARQTWPEQPAWVWWVFPQSAVTRNDPDNAESLFAPAREKPFRHQTHFRVRTLLREFNRNRSKN